MPTYLPRMQNLANRLDVTIHQVRPSTSQLELKHFARFCHEVAACCPGVRNIVFELPCLCHPEGFELERRACGLADDEKRCLTAKKFKQLLRPLWRLRVSQSIRLESPCKSRGERLQPVFDKLAAVIRSSEPIDELRGNEKVWRDVCEKAKPFLAKQPYLGSFLHDLHIKADPRVLMEMYPQHDEQHRQDIFHQSAHVTLEYVEGMMEYKLPQKEES